MKTFYQILLVFCLAIISYTGISQDVGYFVLGESELRNTDIYTILETSDLRLYVGTNKGVYQYKNGAMMPLELALNQKGFSIFDLRENSQGEVFCHNFAGQIFQIVGDKLVLFNEVTETEMVSTVQLFLDVYDQLIFISSKAYVVEKDTILQLPIKAEQSSLGASQLPNGTIVRYYSGEGPVLQISSKGVNHQPLGLETSKGFLYQFQDELVGSTALDKIQFQPSADAKVQGLHNTYFQFANDEIWRRGGKEGLQLLRYDDDQKKLVVKRQMFADRFISHISKSQSGGLILGTFGQGVIVIPTLENQRYNLSHKLKGIQSIACDQYNNVYISDRQKGIYLFDSDTQLTEIERIDAVVPSRVFCSKTSKAGTHKSVHYYQSDVKLWSTKSYQYLPESTILLGTSHLVARKGKYPILADSLWQPHLESGFEKLKKVDGRVNAATYAFKEEKLYVATLSELIEVLPNGSMRNVQYMGEPIMCNQLIYHDNKIWTYTVKHGLLYIEDGAVTQVLSVDEDLGGHPIRKIQLMGQRCYLLQRNTFSVYDLISKKLSHIGKPQGVDIASIEDFDVSEDRLWIAYNDNLLSTPLYSDPELQPNIVLHIDSVKVGKVLLTDETTTSVPPYENVLRAYVDIRGANYQDEAKLRYRLLGFSDKWSQVNAVENQVNYRYLPPGKYTLELEIEWRGLTFQNYQRSFVIEKPFWKKLWFVVVSLVLVALLVGLVIRYQIQRMAKKNAQTIKQKVLESELIESKLKALRSQMNPHFIFNTLNAIQDIVLDNDSNTAYDQLELFSKLIRMALNQSDQPTITIEEEIDFLDTYLRLEQLRFGNKLQYSILANIPLDLHIPTQIIQPFVENAIVHGLFHKQGDKRVDILFDLQEEDLVIVVEDNGIGRQQASDIQQRQKSDHRSFALTALRKRFEILSEKHHVDLVFTIEDTYDSNRKPTGTVVKISLPASLS